MSYNSRIIFLLDRSGSMMSIKDSTIASFNQFIADQKLSHAPGEVQFSLVQFSDECSTIVPSELHQASELTDDTFLPRGNTALYDAMATTIDMLGVELANLPESQRPRSVIMVILTDGEENASRKFTRENVFDRVTHQQEKYSWKFIYLGANQDAINVAGKMGIGPGTSIDYCYTESGVAAAMTSCARAVNSTTRGVEYAFTDEDRNFCSGSV